MDLYLLKLLTYLFKFQKYFLYLVNLLYKSRKFISIKFEMDLKMF